MVTFITAPRPRCCSEPLGCRGLPRSREQHPLLQTSATARPRGEGAVHGAAGLPGGTTRRVQPPPLPAAPGRPPPPRPGPPHGPGPGPGSSPVLTPPGPGPHGAGPRRPRRAVYLLLQPAAGLGAAAAPPAARPLLRLAAIPRDFKSPRSFIPAVPADSGLAEEICSPLTCTLWWLDEVYCRTGYRQKYASERGRG